MKKATLLVVCLLFILTLSGCGLTTCKASGCDANSYKSGYCEYHYALHVGADILGNLFA